MLLPFVIANTIAYYLRIFLIKSIKFLVINLPLYKLWLCFIETIIHVSDDGYICWKTSNAHVLFISGWIGIFHWVKQKNSSVSRANQQAAVRHHFSCRNTTEQIQYDRSSEHNKATLLVEIPCRNHKSSLLSQHPVSQPFFPVCVNMCGSGGESLGIMRSSCGLKLASPVLDYALYLSVFAFHLMTK